MTDIETARKLFRQDGLAFPTIPDALAAKLEQRDHMMFATRELDSSPYFLDHYVFDAMETHVEDYAVLGHSGHGINSYAIQYYLVRGPLLMFLHLSWGGVYSDPVQTAAYIRDCFSLADQLVTAASALEADDQLLVVAAGFYHSYWMARGEHNKCENPHEALEGALGWLTGESDQRLLSDSRRSES